MGKKAQVAGQIFIYLFAAIVFITIFIYGYKAITGFIQKGEDIAFITFKTKLEAEIERISTEPGDVIVFNQRNQLKVPSKYEQVCFIDLEKDPPPITDFCDPSQDYPVICHAWEQKVEENVFLIPPAPSPIFVGKIEIDAKRGDFYDDHYLCLPVKQSLLYLRIEGRGNRAFVTPSD